MMKQTCNIREEIIEMIGDEENVIFYDGLDEAIIGIAERINLGPVVAYDVEKILDIYMTRDGMTYEDAYEFYTFNVIGGWIGELTPIFINKPKY